MLSKFAAASTRPRLPSRTCARIPATRVVAMASVTNTTLTPSTRSLRKRPKELGTAYQNTTTREISTHTWEVDQSFDRAASSWRRDARPKRTACDSLRVTYARRGKRGAAAEDERQTLRRLGAAKMDCRWISMESIHWPTLPLSCWALLHRASRCRPQHRERPQAHE